MRIVPFGQQGPNNASQRLPHRVLGRKRDVGRRG